jgi:transcription elongation factor
MTKLEPKQICRKTKIDFESHPMFLQSRQVRDIITGQMKKHIRLVRKQIVEKDPMKKNISIEYTHDVAAFKNKH